MAFLDTLKQRNTILGSPAGSTYGQEAYFGQPPIRNAGFGVSGQDLDLSTFRDAEQQRQFNLRNRDITDFAAKTRIAGDESIRQENMRRLYNPDMMHGGQPNTVYQPPI